MPGNAQKGRAAETVSRASNYPSSVKLIGALLFMTVLSYFFSFLHRPACEPAQANLLIRGDDDKRRYHGGGPEGDQSSVSSPTVSPIPPPPKLPVAASPPKLPVAVASPSRLPRLPVAVASPTRLPVAVASPSTLPRLPMAVASPSRLPRLPVAVASPSACPRGGSILFSGDGSDIVSVVTDDTADALVGDFTFEWWSKQTEMFSSSPRLFSLYPPSATSHRDVLLAVSLENSAYLWTNGHGIAAEGFSLGASMNSWQHWAVVRNGSTVTMYVMGIARANAILEGALAAPGSSLYIGGRDVSNPRSSRIACLITNFRVVGSALYLYA